MVNSPQKNEGDEEENDLFYFESGHLALKGNKDYSDLLKTLFILQAQQIRAIKDYDVVAAIQKQALENPLEAVEKLKTPEGLGIPEMQILAEIPEIDWSKYDVSVPEDALELIKSETISQSEKYKHIEERDTRRDTHKKPWTTEEQRRLEELLAIYPPELIEIRRFKKIAAALGNRTTKQVCSRVQKYFLKLSKAGLPIPGRIPKSVAKYKKSQHKHQRFNHYLNKPTTFFPELDIPVVMNETEDIPGPSVKPFELKETAPNYLLPGKYREDVECDSNSASNYQLDILKRVKQEKERVSKTDTKPFYHIGFKCDYCGEEPISGARWHCISCESTSIDFCTDCVVAQMYTENSHPLSHQFVTVRGDKTSTTSSVSDTESSSDTSQNYESGEDSKTEHDDSGAFKQKYPICNGSSFTAEHSLNHSLPIKKETNCLSDDNPYDYLHSLVLSNDDNEITHENYT